MKRFFNIIKKYWIYFILVIIAIIICMMSTISPVANEYIGVDSSVFIYVAKSMQSGQVPYVNVFDHKGPLIYFINYLGIPLTNNYIGIWLIEVLFMSFNLIILFKIATMFLKDNIKAIIATIISIFSIVIFFDEGNLTEEYALPFILFSLYKFVQMIKEDNYQNKTNNILIGACLGAVLLLRPNMIAVWIVYYSYIAIKLLRRKKIKILLEMAIFSILGMLVFMLPFIIYLAYNNAISNFINEYLIFNFKYSSYKEMSIKNTIKFFIIKDPIIILITLGYLFFIIVKEERKKWDIIITSLVFFLLSFILVVLPANHYLHYGMILIPTFIIPVSMAISYINNKSLNIVVLIFSVVVLFGFISLNIIKIRNKEEDIYLKISKYVVNNTKEEDRIIVLGNRCLIYLMSNRESASKYIYQYPISNVDSNIKNDFIKELIENEPKIIVKINANDDIIKTINELIEQKKYKEDNEFKFILVKQ